MEEESEEFRCLLKLLEGISLASRVDKTILKEKHNNFSFCCLLTQFLSSKFGEKFKCQHDWYSWMA